MMVGAVELADNIGRRMRQLREAKAELMSMEEDGSDHKEEDGRWMTAWDDVKDK